MEKLTKIHTSNMCSLLYANYTSTKLLKNEEKIEVEHTRFSNISLCVLYLRKKFTSK